MKMQKLLSCLLVLCLLVSVLTPAAGAVAREDQNVQAKGQSLIASGHEMSGVSTKRDQESAETALPEGSWSAELMENAPSMDLTASRNAALEELREAAEFYDEEDVVAAFVVLEDQPMAERYSSITAVPAAASRELVNRQDRLIATISRDVLGGKALDVRYQFTYLTNAFSIRTAFGNLDEIAMVEGVKTVFLMPVYEPCTTEPSLTPMSGPSGEMTRTPQVWQELGYTGTGMKVAIIDTGLDLDHPSFAANPELNEDSMTVEDIEAVLEYLNVSRLKPGVNAGQLYYSAKIPFAFNYVDRNLTADHSSDNQGSHGSHVAGITAANELEGTTAVGMAPDAQVVVMKVFGASGGAYTDDIVAAIEDAMTLGCDVANLSLGSYAGFSSVDPEIDAIYDRIAYHDIIVAIAAGNEGTSSYQNNWGTDKNLTMYPDNATVSSPATYNNTTVVASAQNSHLVTTYFTVGRETVSYSDAIGLYVTFDTLAGEALEYVMVPGLGEEGDFAGVDVSGKIAVVSRGTISFSQKLANAEAAGAIGLVVYNNEPGSIGMQMTDDSGMLPEGVSGMVPAVSVTQEAGELLAKAGIKKLTVAAEMGLVPSDDAGQMSSFSCWGVAPDLRLLPDITAIGGNVYSTVDGGLYETMSGTSMATPQLAGLAALVLEYLHETYPNKADAELRVLADALLMSTAKPIISTQSGLEASPRQQGSGLASAYDAITAQAYLSVPGSDKPKAELFDDVDRLGTYTFAFDIHNMSGSEKTYILSGSALTEDVEEYDGQLFMAGYDRALDAQFSFSQDAVTVRPGGAVRVEVTLTLTGNDKAWLDANYPNGGYVEGYVYARDAEGVDLSLPFLGFYGDWTASPTMDTGFWYDGSFWGDGTVTSSEYWHVLWTGLGYNDWVIGYNPYTGDPADMDPAHFVISNNGDGYIDGISDVYLSLMRNARTVTFTYRDAETGEVYDTEVLEFAQKTMFVSGYGQIVPMLYSWYSDRMYDFTDKDGQPLANNTRVVLEVTATVDYDKHIQDMEGDTISIPLTMDTQAPQLLSVEESARTDGSFVTVTFTDNVAPAAVYVANPTGTRLLAEYTELVAVDGVYTLELDVTGFGTELSLILGDYGANEAAYALTYTLDDNRPAVDDSALYAYRVNDEVIANDTLYGWTTIDPETMTVDTLTSDYMEYYALTAAEYAGGYVFAVDAGYNFLVLVPGLWNRMEICNLGTGILDMTFDESTGTMYAIAKNDYGTRLVTLDLLTGEMETVMDYGYSGPWALAATNDGTFYAIKQGSANLWVLDEAWNMTQVCDAEGNPIAFTTPEERNAYPYYSQSMTWSETDGCLYWAYFSYSGMSCLYTIRFADGAMTYEMQPFDANQEFVGLLTMEKTLTDYTCDGTDCPSAVYEDVQTADWFHEAVDYVTVNGYMNGVDKTLFAPNMTLTRGMLVTILHRMAGAPEAEAASFTDVARDAWYADAVTWATANDITNGMGDGLFCPNVNVTREQMVTFLYRYARYMGVDTDSSFDSLAAYEDAAQVAGYALPAMKWAVGTGLVSGVTETQLCPAMSGTRAQFATILLRMYQTITGSYYIPASGLSGIILSDETVLLRDNTGYELSVRPMPWNAKLGQITWTSSDETVATVENGVITALSAGTATITATCGDLTDTCEVTVVHIAGTVYAYDYYNASGNIEDWISFELENMPGYTSLNQSPVDFLAADYNGHDGYVYGYDGNYQFHRYDPETNEAVALGTPISGYMVMDMAYDYSSGLMFVLVMDQMNWVSRIYCANLHNGTLVEQGVAPDMLLTLACSTEGQLYGINYDGILYAINQPELSGDEGYVPEMTILELVPVVEGLGELGYQQSMCWDHNTDTIIWAYAEASSMVWIDPTTGNYMFLGDPTGTGGFEFMGLYMIPETVEPLPYVAVESACATDLTVMVGASKPANLTVEPLNATNQTVVWTSADPAVARVDEAGNVYGVSQGETMITGTLTDGETVYELSFQVTVMNSADNIYGFVLTDLATYGSGFWMEIYDSAPGQSQALNAIDYTLYAEEYYDGKIYAYGYDAYDWSANWQFMIIDPATFQIVEMMDLGADFNYFVYDMTYDYATSTMYAVAGPSDSASDLFVVNTNTGALIPAMETEPFFMSIAAAPDGTIYAMASSQEIYDPITWSTTFSDATLYTLDVDNGTYTPVGEVEGNTGVKCNMMASMAFDYDTGNLYWTPVFRQDFFSTPVSGFYVVDPETAACVNLGVLGAGGCQVGGLMVFADQYPEETVTGMRSLKLNKDALVVSVGETAAVEATVLPVTLEGVELQYQSSDTSVVTVDENGVITGVAKGSAQVEVTAIYGEQELTARCTVSVLSETAHFFSYNTAYWGWSQISRKDITQTTLVLEDSYSNEALGAMAQAPDGTVYCYDVANGFFTLNMTDGTRTYLGEANVETNEEDGNVFEVRDLNWDAANNRLLALGAIYHREYDEEMGEWYTYEVLGGCRLYQVDVTSGHLTELCAMMDETQVRGMTVDPKGTVYVYNSYDDYFSVLDLTTGVCNDLVSLQSLAMYGSPEHNQALAYDTVTGNIYMLFTGNGSFYQMVTLDPATRILTDLGDIGEVFYDDWTWSYVGETFTGLLIME